MSFHNLRVHIFYTNIHYISLTVYFKRLIHMLYIVIICIDDVTNFFFGNLSHLLSPNILHTHSPFISLHTPNTHCIRSSFTFTYTSTNLHTSHLYTSFTHQYNRITYTYICNTLMLYGTKKHTITYEGIYFLTNNCCNYWLIGNRSHIHI